MIPTTWHPHFRVRDGELLGYLDGESPAVVPRTVFGYALAEGAALDDGFVCSRTEVSPVWASAGS